MRGEAFEWKKMKITSNPNRHIGEAGRRKGLCQMWTKTRFLAAGPGEAVQRQSRKLHRRSRHKKDGQPGGREERGLICFHRRFCGNPYLYGITLPRLAHRETGRLTWLQRAVKHFPSMHWSTIHVFSPLEFLFVSFSCILVEFVCSV